MKLKELLKQLEEGKNKRGTQDGTGPFHGEGPGTGLGKGKCPKREDFKTKKEYEKALATWKKDQQCILLIMDILTDREKLDVWNNTCIVNEWANKYEMDKWFLTVGIQFSDNGSAIPGFSWELDNFYNVEMTVNACDGEMLATLVLKVMTGMTTFSSLLIERYFWKLSTKKFLDDFGVEIPIEIMPKHSLEN